MSDVAHESLKGGGGAFLFLPQMSVYIEHIRKSLFIIELE